MIMYRMDIFRRIGHLLQNLQMKQAYYTYQHTQKSDKNIHKIPTFSYFKDRKIPTFSYFGAKIPTFFLLFQPLLQLSTLQRGPGKVKTTLAKAF